MILFTGLRILYKRVSKRGLHHLINVLQHLDSAVVKIGLDIGIFKILTDSREGVTLEIIGERTGAEIPLLGIHIWFLMLLRM